MEQHLADESGGLPYVQFQALQQGDYQTFSQELRLTSNGEGKVKWIGGLFYSHENDHFATTARNNAVGPPTRSVVPTAILNQQGDVYSAYGQLDVAFTDKFNMNVGLRYTNDDKVGQTTVVAMFDTDTGLAAGTRLPADFLYGRDFVLAHQNSFPTLCAPGVVPCSGPWKDVKQDFSKTGGKLGFDYHFGDNTMGYASYSTGFKSGAFDTRAQAVLLGTGDTPVAPEELDFLRDRLQERVPRPAHEAQRHGVLLRLEGSADLRDDSGHRPGLPEPARSPPSSARSWSGSSRRAMTGSCACTARISTPRSPTSVRSGPTPPSKARRCSRRPSGPTTPASSRALPSAIAADSERQCALRLGAMGHDERAAEHAGGLDHVRRRLDRL